MPNMQGPPFQQGDSRALSGVKPFKTGFYCSDLFINLTER